jgi:2Fe-2S ferredoxin
MVRVVFKDSRGEARQVDAQSGISVMETAIRNDIPGIDGECGGACSCATCHVYVDVEWWEKVGEPSGTEEDMLDFALERRQYSRLSCQIRITEDLEGLVVTTPENQG